MLRWIMPLLVAIFAVGTAAADRAPSPPKRRADAACRQPSRPSTDPSTAKPRTSTASHGSAAVSPPRPHAAAQSPAPRRPGAPRSRCAQSACGPSPRPLQIPNQRAPPHPRGGRHGLCRGRDPELLFTPSEMAASPTSPRCPAHRSCRVRSTIPGYYGRAFPTIIRAPITAAPICQLTGIALPYACGVYGYC